MSQKLKTIMVENVKTAGLEDTVQDVAMLMNKHQIGCVIIVNEEQPVGIVTERDIMKRVVSKGKNPKNMKAIDVMSKPLITASPCMPAGDAAKAMLKWNIKKLPVAEKGRLVGVVTLTDLLRVEGVIETLNGTALNGASKRLKKTIEIYYDAGIRQKTRKCPLMYKDGMSIGCRLEKCMWWAEDECAITKLTRLQQFAPLGEEKEVSVEYAKLRQY
jgi:CBS domain-containing protein